MTQQWDFKRNYFSTNFLTFISPKNPGFIDVNKRFIEQIKTFLKSFSFCNNICFQSKNTNNCS